MKIPEPFYYVADFETVVVDTSKENVSTMTTEYKERYIGANADGTYFQKRTEVWSAAIVALDSDTPHVFSNIGQMIQWLMSQRHRYMKVGFHNLKFDGHFILTYLIEHNFKFACFKDACVSKFELEHGQFICNISSKGQWYSICFRYKNVLIEFFDTLKLLPFSLNRLGKAFETKHRKLEMDYTGNRFPGCKISPEEMNYIKNDVLVLKEALNVMYGQGHTHLTIGGCCLDEYESIMLSCKKDYAKMFPNLHDVKLDPQIYGEDNADSYIRHSYRGGWCYVVKGKEGRHTNGLTADVNSLYPSVMHSESGSRYPIGVPSFWQGKIPDEAKGEDKYYFVRVKCQFKIKDNYLPWVQIKGHAFYNGTECLESSDFTVFNHETKEWEKVDEICGVKAIPILTFTCKDYELFKEHYDVYNETVLDGCYFDSEIGIFDEYINKWAEVKKTSKGAKRQIAKLFLNNLYGKMATSPDAGFKTPVLRDDGSLSFDGVIANDWDKIVHIACGSAVTSYAKNFTIRTAQKNYYGKDKRGFIYADTDSIHCDLRPEELVDVPVHPTDFNHWKLESFWDDAIFVRQKTYIEHVTHEDEQLIEKPYYNVKCAGMPDKCKNLFLRSMDEKRLTESEIKDNKWGDKEVEFLSKNRSLDDFRVGLCVPGKLMPKRISGGVLLVEDCYTMN